MEIRKIQARDFDEWFKLEEQYTKYNNKVERVKALRYKVSKNGRKKWFLKRLKKRDKLFLVLAEGNKLQGYFYGLIEKINGNGYYYKTSRIGYIGNVFISRKYRGKGYFSCFLKEFFNFLKRRRVKYCILHVDIGNKPAIDAYQKSKFLITEYKMVCKV
ncbi:MAG: GNAT family N-acetyltransferase [Candidatus Woesearchaeota archaeon]